MTPQAEQRAAEATAEVLREMIAEHCDLCGSAMTHDVFTAAAFEASGLHICPTCLEAMIDATTDNARAEVGLVGGGH